MLWVIENTNGKYYLGFDIHGTEMDTGKSLKEKG